MNKKLVYVVLGLVGLVLLAVGGTLFFTLRAPEPTPTAQPDIPRYTADQVIDVARSYYPATEAEKRYVDIAWELKYIGKGVWQVDRIYVWKEGVPGHYAGSRNLNDSWFFHETTGEFEHITYEQRIP